MTQIHQLTLLVRHPDLSREQFRTYWHEVHAPLVRQLPHIVSYTQHHVVKAEPRSHYPAPAMDVDGVVEFVFDSEQGAQNAFAGDLGQEVLEDAKSFISSMVVLSVESVPVVQAS